MKREMAFKFIELLNWCVGHDTVREDLNRRGFDFDAMYSSLVTETNKLEMDLGFTKLVVEEGMDPDYKEFFISLEDHNGCYIQDIAVIGQDYHYDDDLEVVNEDKVRVLVYADEGNEDYTHKFVIEKY